MFEQTALSDFDRNEKISGIIERITFHNPENGWSIVKVSPFNNSHEKIAVIIYQANVFAGATVDFYGKWINHAKYGKQFVAEKVLEQRPANLNALEKYIGSGLIYGVGPKTAKKIVKHFKNSTLDIFEKDISRLTEVEGIAHKKLVTIQQCWQEHKSIRDVMIFLQNYGVSTLYAVKIFKTYGNESIQIVQDNPYRLAKDIYGIGFFSADKIALSLGFDKYDPRRLKAGIKHVLDSSRDEGHCYLLFDQIQKKVHKLFDEKIDISLHLKDLCDKEELMLREIEEEKAYYAKSLYFDELAIVNKLKKLLTLPEHNLKKERILKTIKELYQKRNFLLSPEQELAVIEILQNKISILTGGPGCGKTTTTKAFVLCCHELGLRTTLTAPTGRAAQRMSEVIGKQAQTVHRLLGLNPSQNSKKYHEDNHLPTDFLIIDECSMLDVQLMANILKAVPPNASILFIGDADQLPSVGAGNVFRDLVASPAIPTVKLTKVFRQAAHSSIIKHAHQINAGERPMIASPFKHPQLWQKKRDCLFLDSNEATQEEQKFIYKVKDLFKSNLEKLENIHEQDDLEEKENNRKISDIDFSSLNIPEKFKHVDMEGLGQLDTNADQLKAILKKVHPFSSLHYGLTATALIVKLYNEIIPKYYPNHERQILSPMIRGSMGTATLNQLIQKTSNPPREGKKEIKVGDKIFRTGDRVIQKRNNYDLNVFNGDIGQIQEIDLNDKKCLIRFDLKSKFPREVVYEQTQLIEMDLAYAITIHKSQGSEFDVVIIPLFTQHFKMLYRNLIYTGLTRAKKLAVFLGTRKALTMSVNNLDSRKRQSAIQYLLAPKK